MRSLLWERGERRSRAAYVGGVGRSLDRGARSRASRSCGRWLSATWPRDGRGDPNRPQGPAAVEAAAVRPRRGVRARRGRRASAPPRPRRQRRRASAEEPPAAHRPSRRRARRREAPAAVPAARARRRRKPRPAAAAPPATGVQTLSVEPDEAEMRVDRFLTRALPAARLHPYPAHRPQGRAAHRRQAGQAERPAGGRPEGPHSAAEARRRGRAVRAARAKDRTTAPS